MLRMETSTPTPNTKKVKAPRLTLEQAIQKAEKIKQEHRAAQLELARLKHEKKKADESAEREKDTRRKILLGAYLMAQAKSQGWELAGLCLGQQPLADYLTREDDRALFSLPPIPVLTAQVQEPESEGAAAPPEGQPAG